MGIGEVVPESTLTTANENRSYLIYAASAMLLIKEAKQLYIDDDDAGQTHLKRIGYE